MIVIDETTEFQSRKADAIITDSSVNTTGVYWVTGDECLVLVKSNYGFAITRQSYQQVLRYMVAAINDPTYIIHTLSDKLRNDAIQGYY